MFLRRKPAKYLPGRMGDNTDAALPNLNRSKQQEEALNAVLIETLLCISLTAGGAAGTKVQRRREWTKEFRL